MKSSHRFKLVAVLFAAVVCFSISQIIIILCSPEELPVLSYFAIAIYAGTSVFAVIHIFECIKYAREARVFEEKMVKAEEAIYAALQSIEAKLGITARAVNTSQGNSGSTKQINPDGQ